MFYNLNNRSKQVEAKKYTIYVWEKGKYNYFDDGNHETLWNFADKKK